MTTGVKDMDSLMEFTKDMATKRVDITNKDFGPAIIVFTQEELSMYFPGELPKEHFREVFSKVFNTLGVIGYVLCTFAWMAATDSKSAVSKLLDDNQIQIADLPLDDRTEVIWLVGCERGKKPLSFISKVKGEDKYAVGEWQQIPEIDGRLVISEW